MHSDSKKQRSYVTPLFAASDSQRWVIIMGLTPDELVKEISRKDLEVICLTLLYKRESDGLNGRTWNARKHLMWETRLSVNLQRHDYLGHISEIPKKLPNKPVDLTPNIQPKRKLSEQEAFDRHYKFHWE